MKNELLLIPDKPDIERDSIAKVWEQRGGEVKRIGKFWIKPETNNKRVAIYGNDSFCLVLAQILELQILMVKDEWIANLDFKFLKRKIEISSIEKAHNINFPKFIKPATPKLFQAQIFTSINDLNLKIEGIEKNELLLCSEIIEVEKEVRSFILNKKIQDLAFYEGKGQIEESRKFIQTFLSESKIEFPKTFVLDVGFNEELGWFVIEFNSTWGAGLNFCNPEKVVECIREAVIN